MTYADLPGFRAGIEAYGHAVSSLALRLLPVYAVALDLEPDFFSSAFAQFYVGDT